MRLTYWSSAAVLVISQIISTDGALELSRKIPHQKRFRTEPDYLATYFEIESAAEDHRLLAPGFIFIDPVYGSEQLGYGGTHAGPQIREQDGTLVWYGGATESYGSQTDRMTAPVRGRVQDFHVCDYMNSAEQHLCWSERVRGKKKKIIVDQGYNLVKEWAIPFKYNGDKEEDSNLHEFRVVDNGSAFLQPAWPTREADLLVIGAPKDGRIWDGCFQEIGMDDGRVLFEWCSMDYFPIWETNLFPTNGPNVTGNITSPKVGTGEDDSPFDAWHVNALDKNFEGDYLVSSRHNDQILKVAGNDNVHGVDPGTTLWRLGGRGSNVGRLEDWTMFSKQHGVRYVRTTSEETTFTILDNAWEGALAPSNNVSSGMVISVNNNTKTARLRSRYEHPKNAITPSQGAMQTLPNSNIFISWGALGQYSEYSSTGNLLLHASYYTHPDREKGDVADHRQYTWSYRVFKQPWIGKPMHKPKLIAYTLNCISSAPLMSWVSWNGATEVRYWRYYVSSNKAGPWFSVGTFPRTGFETETVLSDGTFVGRAFQQFSFPRYVSVEALDEKYALLPSGVQLTETFVPRHLLRQENCTQTGCFEDSGHYYDVGNSIAGRCSASQVPQVLVLILLLAIVESVSLVSSAIIEALMRSLSPDSNQQEPSSLTISRYPLSHTLISHDWRDVEDAISNDSLDSDSGTHQGHLTARPGFVRTHTPNFTA